MAPDIVYENLPYCKGIRRVLDPMAGSGTTVAIARARGYAAYGVDTDPLALIIARANSSDVSPARLRRLADSLLLSAKRRAQRLHASNAYPAHADQETCDFIDFWFDKRSRVELTALSRAIMAETSGQLDFIKCAFSRMIVTKKNGVSLAEDVSHSRPHRTRSKPPIYPFEAFPRAVEIVSRSSSFSESTGLQKSTIKRADCRSLPFDSRFFDIIITSPPYLNAIDYLRGHRLSLVWLGFTVSELRTLRTANIGADRALHSIDFDPLVTKMVPLSEPPSRLRNRLRRYVSDLNESIAEMARVSKRGATLVVVVGDSTIRGHEIRNSIAVDSLARRHRFARTARLVRGIPENKRYLPPPSMRGQSLGIESRMWEEVILFFKYER